MHLYMKERFYTPPRETSVKNNVGIRRVKSVKSHTNTQNLFPDNFFDFQTSFETTISTVKEV